jgi:hypothetical protein
MDIVDKPWERIVDDVFATTGHRLVLELNPAPDYWWDCDVIFDGIVQGTTGFTLPVNEEAFVVELADQLCEGYLHEEIWGGWPICPDHGTHPLEPSLDQSGNAVWLCPIGRAVARIGSLRPSSAGTGA